MSANSNPNATRALARAISATLPPDLLAHLHAPQSATKTHAAPHPQPPLRKSNPPRPPSDKPLNPNQLTAARLLLAGHSVNAVAASLALDPYTISRWKKDPRFQTELRLQVYLQTTHTAPQEPTPRHNPSAPAHNEPTMTS
jgi:hypothetical protein